MGAACSRDPSMDVDFLDSYDYDYDYANEDFAFIDIEMVGKIPEIIEKNQELCNDVDKLTANNQYLQNSILLLKETLYELREQIRKEKEKQKQEQEVSKENNLSDAYSQKFHSESEFESESKRSMLDNDLISESPINSHVSNELNKVIHLNPQATMDFDEDITEIADSFTLPISECQIESHNKWDDERIDEITKGIQEKIACLRTCIRNRAASDLNHESLSFYHVISGSQWDDDDDFDKSIQEIGQELLQINELNKNNENRLEMPSSNLFRTQSSGKWDETKINDMYQELTVEFFRLKNLEEKMKSKRSSNLYRAGSPKKWDKASINLLYKELTTELMRLKTEENQRQKQIE